MSTNLLIIMCLAVAATHILSAIKSGMFYAVSMGHKPKLLEKFISNMHFVQTPFWYSCFGTLFVAVLAIYWDDYKSIWLLLVKAYLITQGVSTTCGPFYQGFINVGCGKDFTDKDERKEFEFAVSVKGKSWTTWIPKWWYGTRRWLLLPVGILMITFGFLI